MPEEMAVARTKTIADLRSNDKELKRFNTIILLSVNLFTNKNNK